MANIIDDGGGLGTAGTICQISPGDEQKIIGNLISRIENLEFALSQITGANLHAQTLGDLSSQVGWVYGVTYMGVPGWTQTEYGTLIPPAGFTLSDMGFTLANACTGEETPYQGVITDSDGVLQFGWTPTGSMCGEMVEQWNDGGLADYYIMAPFGSGNGSRGVVLTDSTVVTSGGHTKSALYTFTVASAGVYQISASCHFETNPGMGDTGTMLGTIAIDINSDPFGDIATVIASNEFYNEHYIMGANYSNGHVLEAGDEVNIHYFMTLKNGTLNSRAIDNIRVSIMKRTTA